jgi:Mesyanzhinovviridae DNA helicase
MPFADVLAADFRLPPFEHQLKEFEDYCDAEARAYAWTMRTGKTKEAIDKACHLYARRHKIDGVLIFAPNGVHANWIEKELPKHKWRGVRTNCLTWRSSELSQVTKGKFDPVVKAWVAELRKAKHTPDLMVLAVPTESMHRKDVRGAIKYFMERRRFLVIFDESDDWGVPGTKRTLMARAIAKRAAFRIIMSGTMLTGSPLAAFSQFELLKPGALGFTTHEQFKDRYCDVEMARGKGGQRFPKVVGFKNMPELQARMAKYMSVVRREDVKDMPDLIVERREFDGTPEQLRVYRELHDSIMTEIADRSVSIGELAPKIQKLQQVFSGFVIDQYRQLHRIPGPNPRLQLLRDEVYTAPGKVVIWCHFQEDIDNVCAALRLEGYEVAEYHGRVSDKGKSESLQRFRTHRDCKALVGHAQSCGRGQDFAVASEIIWYSHTFKARYREQAMDRATEIGGNNVQVRDLVGPGPDRYILKTTAGRIDMNNFLTGDSMKQLLRSLAL